MVRALGPPPGGMRARASRGEVTAPATQSAAPAPPAGRPAPRAALRLLGVAGAYLLIAIGWTWPLATRLTTAIPGDGKDGWQNAWNLWWVATALNTGRWPWRTDLLFHPYGADLYLHPLEALNGLLAWPLLDAAGVVPAYNAIVFFSLVASAVAMYALARDRLRRAGAAPAGAWARAAPVRGRAALRVQPLHGRPPAEPPEPDRRLGLAAERAGAVAGRGVDGGHGGAAWAGALGPPLLGAGALTLTGLCDWQFLLFLALGTAGWGVVMLARRQWRALPGLALSWGGAALALSPLIVGTALQAARTPASSFSGFAGDIVTYSADLLAYVVPSPFHPWWGDWALAILRPWPATLIEKVMFPTYTALALAGVALASARARGRRGGRWPVGGWAAAALGLRGDLARPVAPCRGRAMAGPAAGPAAVSAARREPDPRAWAVRGHGAAGAGRIDRVRAGGDPGRGADACGGTGPARGAGGGSLACGARGAAAV